MPRSIVPLWISSVLRQTGNLTHGILHGRTHRALPLSQMCTEGRLGTLSSGPVWPLTVCSPGKWPSPVGFR